MKLSGSLTRGGFSEVYSAVKLDEHGEPLYSVAVKHIVKQPWTSDWEVHTKLIRQEVSSLKLLAGCPRGLWQHVSF